MSGIGKSRIENPKSKIFGRSPADIPAQDRMKAKDLARAEGCSPDTARRLMRRIGPIHGRNRRDRWIDRQLYTRWLQTI